MNIDHVPELEVEPDWDYPELRNCPGCGMTVVVQDCDVLGAEDDEVFCYLCSTAIPCPDKPERPTRPPEPLPLFQEQT